MKPTLVTPLDLGRARGNFVMLPILGPSTVRAAFGASVDAYMSPTGQMMNDEAYWGLRVFNVLDIRAGLLDAEEIMTGDRYVFFRDVYLQSRAVLEAGGQVKDDFSSSTMTGTRTISDVLFAVVTALLK